MLSEHWKAIQQILQALMFLISYVIPRDLFLCDLPCQNPSLTHTLAKNSFHCQFFKKIFFNLLFLIGSDGITCNNNIIQKQQKHC